MSLPPSADQAQTEIEELRQDLERHNYLYYVKAEPEISDAEFDRLMRRLQELEEAFPQFQSDNSPSVRVGGQVTEHFRVYRHKKRMLSLANAYSLEELREFDRRVRQGLGGADFSYWCQQKYDGVALSLHYQQGRFVRAVTRGDGTQGDDITPNVRTIRTAPLRLRGSGWPDELEVRGEVYMTQTDFEELNRQREARGESRLMNPRNTTAGALKLQDSSIVAARPLTFVPYYLDAGAHTPATDQQAIGLLQEWGFRISPHDQRCATLAEVEDYIQAWDAQRAELDYAIDGVVLKVNELELREELGTTAKSPRWAIAYKYPPEQAVTVLNKVDYQVGRTGYITPVAHLEPVVLAGTVVKRASLYNYDELQRLDLHTHDRVRIEKSGEIIPKVLSVVKEQRPNSAQPVSAPRDCPACGAELTRQEGEVAWFCPNSQGCPPQIKGRIEHFAQRKALDIDGLGSEIVAQLVDAGLVRDYTDLYSLTYDDLVGLERFADKSAKNLLDALQASKQIPFHRVLFGLGIRYVGENVAQKLAEHFGSLQALEQASVEELAGVHEIGQRIAESVASFFADPQNQQRMQRLRQLGLTLEAETRERKSDRLADKRVLVSGSFEGYSRDELKALIVSHGGQNATGVTSKLDYLVAGDKMGPAKRDKAEQFGIPILGLEEFLDLLAGSGAEAQTQQPNDAKQQPAQGELFNNAD